MDGGNRKYREKCDDKEQSVLCDRRGERRVQEQYATRSMSNLEVGHWYIPKNNARGIK